jgi:hypothetical protein
MEKKYKVIMAFGIIAITGLIIYKAVSTPKEK